MKKYFYLILILSVPLFSGFIQKEDNITQGDNYFVKMKYREALYFYQQDLESSEAQWKISRTYIVIADTASGTFKRNYIRHAETAARKAIALNDTCAAGHTWLAAALGNKAIFEGSKEKIRLCNTIKAELNRAIQLNPNDDVAYSILGTFYRQLGSITWVERQLAEAFLGSIPAGGYADSEIKLKKAIAISPTTIRHHYEIGLLYKVWGKKELAKSSFTKAQSLPLQVYSDYTRKKHIEELLKQ